MYLSLYARQYLFTNYARDMEVYVFLTLQGHRKDYSKRDLKMGLSFWYFPLHLD